MTMSQTFEAKLIAAFNEFADEAVIDVDAMVVAERVAGRASRHSLSFGFSRLSKLVPVAATILLVAALITGVIAAAQLLRGPRVYDGHFVPQHNILVPRGRPVVLPMNDGRVLVAGGAYEASAAGNSAEVVNPATGAVTTITGDVPGISGTGIQLPDGRLFVVDYEWYNELARAYLVDPQTAVSRAIGPEPRTSPLSLVGQPEAVLLDDGRVLLAGGAERILPSMLFDPATDTFAQTGSMLQARIHPALVKLSDGRVLAAGGRTVVPPASIYFGVGRLLDDAEIYDPQTGNWTFAGHMQSVEGPAWGAALSDGRIVIVSSDATDSIFGAGLNYKHTADVYTPSTATFASLAVDWPGQATMTALPGDKVLLTGSRTPSQEELQAGARLVRWAAVYDAIDNVTTVVQPPRAIFPSGVVLADQRVLVVGGYSDEVSGSRPVNWIETFE